MRRLSALSGLSVAFARSTRCCHSASSDCYYNILEVSPGASQRELKQSFQRLAKKLHPDVNQNDSPGNDKFRRLLTAYQVLSNPESRAYYDVSRDDRAPSFVKAASKTMSERRRAEVPDLPFWSLFDLTMWRVLATSTDVPVAPKTGSAALDRALDTFAVDLHSAIHKAYHGPSLVGLPRGWLPRAFEAEPRSQAACLAGAGATGDLLQLVSGRTLLGCVRLQQIRLIDCDDTPDAEQPHDEEAGAEVIDLEYVMDGDVLAGCRHWRHPWGSWAEVRGGEGDAVIACLVGDAVTDAAGAHSHTLTRFATPGVANVMVSADALGGKVICHATRASLPNSRFWLFPPRDEEYEAGWYVEWCGQEQAEREGWLHPAVICFILALQTLGRSP